MRCFLILVCAAAFVRPGRADEPRDELLRMVPDDTAICLVVQGLRDRSKAVEASPLAEWMRTHFKPVVGAAPELQKIKDVEKLFTTFLGVSLTELRDDIFGDAIVFSYQPGPPGRPEGERGFLMVKARDPVKLTALVNKLNTLQKSSGELVSVDGRTYREKTYFQRNKGEGGSEYYWLSDGLFVFAAQESSIKSIIDRQLDSRSAAGAVAKSVARLGVQNAFIYCWFNPRQLDADVKAHVGTAANDRERSMRRQFAQIWSSVDDLAVYLDADKELEVGISAAYRSAAMPPELRVVLGAKPRASALWQVVPDDALVAVAGRVTGAELLNVVLAFAPPDERPNVRQDFEKAIGAVVGKEKIPALFGGIGPDWAAWVAAPTSDGWFPDITAAVQVRDSEPSVADDLRRTLDFYSQLLRVQYNREHDGSIDSKVQKIGNADVTSFGNEKVFPPGLRPAYGVRNGYLVLGSSPDRIGAFERPPAENAAAPRAPILRVSGNAIRAYLDKHGDKLAGWIADRQERPAANVLNEIQAMAEFSKVVNRCEIYTEGRGDVMKLALRFTFVEPLSK